MLVFLVTNYPLAYDLTFTKMNAMEIKMWQDEI
jgi:hypothetical protein